MSTVRCIKRRRWWFLSRVFHPDARLIKVCIHSPSFLLCEKLEFIFDTLFCHLWTIQEVHGHIFTLSSCRKISQFSAEQITMNENGKIAQQLCQMVIKCKTKAAPLRTRHTDLKELWAVKVDCDVACVWINITTSTDLQVHKFEKGNNSREQHSVFRYLKRENRWEARKLGRASNCRTQLSSLTHADQ